MMKFKAHVKSVTANVAKKTIAISFTMELTDEALASAEALAFHVDRAAVNLSVEPKQMSLTPLPTASPQIGEHDLGGEKKKEK